MLPVRSRRFLQRVVAEAPDRLRDLPKDSVCRIFPDAFGGIPPPCLRSRVGGVSRREFVSVGQEGSRTILDAFQKTRELGRSYPAWLDLGCGCGRIARTIEASGEIRELTGVDVDAAQIGWASRNLRGRFSVMRPAPPLAFESGLFDVVYVVSVFTHWNEDEQFRWLAEIERILTPGGLLIATTHSTELASTCPGLTGEDFHRLAEQGFLAVDRRGSFNERASFHSAAYLEREWGSRMRRRLFEPYGFVSYQDLSVWERARASGPR